VLLIPAWGLERIEPKIRYRGHPEYASISTSWAAEKGYEAVVKLLLAKDGVDPNSWIIMIGRPCCGLQLRSEIGG
jgi:hypothetical protein